MRYKGSPFVGASDSWFRFPTDEEIAKMPVEERRMLADAMLMSGMGRPPVIIDARTLLKDNP